MNTKKIFISIFALFLLTSCATTIKDFEKYEKAPLLQTEFMPDANSIYKAVPSVLILPFQTNSENAKQINANSVVENEISNILLSSKLVTIQDRKNLEKLNQEIKLAELQNSTTSDIKSVNFAIDGEVTSVDFSSSYISEAVDRDTGKVIRKAQFEYMASTRGIIKIFEIPTLRVIDTIPFFATAYSYEDAQDNGISIDRFKLKNTKSAKQFDGVLAQKSVKNAVNSATNKLKSAFAKTGYIMEKRVLKDKTIFLVSLGANDGITQDTKVQIYQRYQELNPLTQKSETLERRIANGVVADKTENTKTWIVIKDANSNLIKLGDVVKIVY